MSEEKMRAAFRKLFKYEMSDDAESETFARGYQAALQESEAGAVTWTLDKARRYVIQYNDDGEFGQVTGWLFSFADDFYPDGTPAYVWGKLPVTVESVSPVTGMTPTQQRIHDMVCQAETDKAVIEQLTTAPPSAQAIETAAIMRAEDCVISTFNELQFKDSDTQLCVKAALGDAMVKLRATIPQDGRTKLEEFGMKVAQEVKSATVYNECRNMLTKENELRAIVTNQIGEKK